MKEGKKYVNIIGRRLDFCVLCDSSPNQGLCDTCRIKFPTHKSFIPEFVKLYDEEIFMKNKKGNILCDDGILFDKYGKILLGPGDFYDYNDYETSDEYSKSKDDETSGEYSENDDNFSGYVDKNNKPNNYGKYGNRKGLYKAMEQDLEMFEELGDNLGNSLDDCTQNFCYYTKYDDEINKLLSNIKKETGPNKPSLLKLEQIIMQVMKDDEEESIKLSEAKNNNQISSTNLESFEINLDKIKKRNEQQELLYNKKGEPMKKLFSMPEQKRQ